MCPGMEVIRTCLYEIEAPFVTLDSITVILWGLGGVCGAASAAVMNTKSIPSIPKYQMTVEGKSDLTTRIENVLISEA